MLENPIRGIAKISLSLYIAKERSKLMGTQNWLKIFYVFLVCDKLTYVERGGHDASGEIAVKDKGIRRNNGGGGKQRKLGQENR